MAKSCHASEAERALCFAGHDGYHHARSMDEIQKALKEDRKVYDPDGDSISSARIMPKQSKRSPTALGNFYLGTYRVAYRYRVDQILVKDEPFNEEEAMKMVLASLAKAL